MTEPTSTQNAVRPVAVAEALLLLLEEAFTEGFRAPATYNDTVENSPAEEWGKEREYYRAKLASILAQPSVEAPAAVEVSAVANELTIAQMDELLEVEIGFGPRDHLQDVNHEDLYRIIRAARDAVPIVGVNSISDDDEQESLAFRYRAEELERQTRPMRDPLTQQCKHGARNQRMCSICGRFDRGEQ